MLMRHSMALTKHMRVWTVLIMMFISGPAAAATVINATVQGFLGDADLDGSPDGYGTNLLETFFVDPREDRGFAEFDLSGLSGPLASASLNLTSTDSGGSATISLYGYAGDGTISLSDWALGASGTLLHSFA